MRQIINSSVTNQKKRVKKVYICSTCKGNGYLKFSSLFENEQLIEQCFDCDSQGELYDYEDNGSFDDVGSAQSVH